MHFPSEAEVERLLALPTPPSSPLISLSPPSVEECLARCLAAPALPSSPLPIVPHPYGRPPSPLSPWSSPLPQIPSPPLHVSSPPLPLPPPTIVYSELPWID
ncbi:hypothetical protein Tco_1445278 [Tanacetum coccineum]